MMMMMEDVDDDDDHNSDQSIEAFMQESFNVDDNDNNKQPFFQFLLQPILMMEEFFISKNFVIQLFMCVSIPFILSLTCLCL